MDTKSKLPPNIRLIPSIRADTKASLVELDDEQIIAELFDYADEIQAWLDIHFANEYEEYSDDEKFMETVRIMADLEFMAKQIEKEFD